MGLLTRLFGEKRTEMPGRLEVFLKQFADDPNLADRMISGTSPKGQRGLAICLACLYSAYEATVRLRESFNKLPRLDPAAKAAFPFDAALEEVIAFYFWTLMAKGFEASDRDDDNDQDDERSDDDYEKALFESTKMALNVAATICAKHVDGREPAWYQQRVLAYSYESLRRKSTLEEHEGRLTALLCGPDGLLDPGAAIALRLHSTSSAPETLQRGVRALVDHYSG